MFTGNPVHTSRERNHRRNSPMVHSVLAVFFQRNLAPIVMTGDGVSTNLALIFGTLLSSQGTVASFVLTLSGFPPGFPSVFPTLSDLSDPISSVLSRFPLSRFPFRRFRLYQTLSASDPRSAGLSGALGFRSSAFRHSLR